MQKCVLGKPTHVLSDLEQVLDRLSENYFNTVCNILCHNKDSVITPVWSDRLCPFCNPVNRFFSSYLLQQDRCTYFCLLAPSLILEACKTLSEESSRDIGQCSWSWKLSQYLLPLFKLTIRQPAD